MVLGIAGEELAPGIATEGYDHGFSAVWLL
jgi:hypothetical protein